MLTKVLVMNSKQENGPIGFLKLTQTEKLLVNLKLFKNFEGAFLVLKIGENNLVFSIKEGFLFEFETIYHNLMDDVFAIITDGANIFGVAKSENAEFDEQVLLEEFKKSQNETKTQSLEEEKKDDVAPSEKTDLKEKIENTTNFFEMIKEQFDALFEENEHFLELEEQLEGTKWVKVLCDEENGGHYILGKIFDGGVLTHIAYGTFAENALQKPPEGLEKYCQFLPLNIDDELSSGYFVMYQDAITGENVVL